METDTIKEMEFDALELTDKHTRCTERAINIKTDAIREVELEWETTENKALSNQTKRKIAVDAELENNEEYPFLINDIKELTKALRKLEINIAFEKRQFQRETNHTESIHDIRLVIHDIKVAMNSITSSLNEIARQGRV